MSDHSKFNLREHCHVNTNSEGDRFVGIKVDSQRAMVYFPLGYELPDDNNELRTDIKNLIRILATFTDKSDRVLHLNHMTTNQMVEFPIQAYLNIIDYYFQHNGYYTEHESIYRVGANGKINWSKTIKTQKPLFQNNSPVYLTTVVRQTNPNTNQLITKINQYCVYHSFTRIGWLFTANQPAQPDIMFNKNLFLSVLNQKLAHTNNDLDKQLFKSMIALIDFNDSQTIDHTVYFGTDKFETVWERLIDRYFGIKHKENYFPHAKWVERRFGENQGHPTHALEPDSIMIYRDNYYVLDAKYYSYGVFPTRGVSALPQSSDINKQITYGQFVQNQHANNQVFNAFLMPFNQKHNRFQIDECYGNVAEAVGDWVKTDKTKTYQKIQGIVVDTRYLLKNYDGNHDRDKELLSTQIEWYFHHQ